jgi:hypothetical protein
VKDIRKALRSFLLADSAIVAVVVDRIYALKIPQGGVPPSIVVTRVSGPGDYHLAGPSGLISARIQVDAWGVTADAATTLANLVKDRLDGYRGTMGTGGNIITVHGVFVADLREDYDDDAELYRSGRDYFVHHLEI